MDVSALLVINVTQFPILYHWGYCMARIVVVKGISYISYHIISYKVNISELGWACVMGALI